MVVYNEVHDLAYHCGGGFSYSEVYNMPIYLRRYSIHRINEHLQKQKDAQEEAQKEVTFKYLTHRDEKKIEEELKGRKKANQEAGELTTRLKHIIQSIDGDYEKKTIREYVDNQLLARDSRALREHMKNIGPDVDMTFEYEDENGEMQRGVNVPLNITFLWPDA